MYQINSISISAPTDIQKKCGFPDVVDDSNVKKVMELQDAEGKDVVLANGWDKIII